MRKFSLFLSLLIVFQVFAQSDIEVINIENRAVQDYMIDSERTYTENPDYRVSVITKYNDTNKYGKKLYWPNGKTVYWTPSAPPAEIQEIRITVSENEDYTNAWTFNPDKKTAATFVNSGTYIIRNLLPNCTYYYKVEEFMKDGGVNETTSGVFQTVGQVRMIQVRNSSNIRDLGGWQTQYGVPVKYGKLFRSASLETMTSDGRHDFVDNLGVLAELDLRHETKRTTSCLGADKDYLRMEHVAYLNGIKNNHSTYARDLKWIIDRMREGKNVDWHCAIGCDRCGTLSFLIEGLLGLNEIDLCRDYELSTLSLGRNNRRVRSPLKSMIAHIKTFGGPDDYLATCFYNYWRRIGLKKSEIDFFLYEMLGITSRVRSLSQNENNK